MARNLVSIGYSTIHFHFPNEMYPFTKYQLSSIAVGIDQILVALSVRYQVSMA